MRKEAKVAINGFGTIGKRVADAVSRQDDMRVMGVVKTRPSFEAKIAAEKGYPIYVASEKNLSEFANTDIDISGTLNELLDQADIVIDATPGNFGEEYKKLYQKHGIRAIWQGGEDHELTGFSFNSEANYDQALGLQFARVVSCNTTGLVRALYALDTSYVVKKARVTLIRRAADPGDAKTGPINAIIPDPIKTPSHHGPDVNSILPNLNITTAAMKTSTTLMHLHALNVELEKDATIDEIIRMFYTRPRIRLVSTRDKIKSTADIMEFAKDMGRPRGDMWENVIWLDSISKDKDGELYLFQAIHQESDVMPENIDAIRALLEMEDVGCTSIKKTNKAIGIKR